MKIKIDNLSLENIKYLPDFKFNYFLFGLDCYSSISLVLIKTIHNKKLAHTLLICFYLLNELVPMILITNPFQQEN